MIKYLDNGVYELKTIQKLPISLKESWSFFSNPKNLFKITPTHMNFKILTDFNKIYEGQIIKYRVSPFPLFRVGWTTKITHVEEPFSFIDKQISGPFTIWEHEHIFEKSNNETIAYDIVKFKLPLGILGRVLGSWLVKFQLRKIFEFREKQLTKIFKK
tara:strand:+ start:504 stop:977 length:474 start_codon:yes stop_codon:yes gene_type:complete